METAALFLLVLFFSIGITEAVYKQWIPDTNFENVSNWDERRVPCSQDKVIFPGNKKVSVYVQTTHSLADMNMPWDGEFILAPGAGFSASAEVDPECDKGSEIHFHDPGQDLWFDPRLWHAALSTGDLNNGKFIFSVDAERVPCQFDDVIFSPDTSFQVNFKATGSTIRLKSISVLGKRFTGDEEFSQHLQSNTGRLQFPGPAAIHITDVACGDKTGCECGNTGVLQVICSAGQLVEKTCPKTPCKTPLSPVGHCCKICGAIITLDYTSDFIFDDYRNRLVDTFLSLPQYSLVKLAISKVQKQQRGLAKIPHDSSTEIQIVIIDEKNGSPTGSDVESLANDIMDDLKTHGTSLGISKGTLVTSSGSLTGDQVRNRAGTIAGIVIGVLLICVSVPGILYFLHRAGIVRLSYFTQLFMRNHHELEEECETEQKGFENPIFEADVESAQDTPGLYSGEEALKETIQKQSGMQFSNPLYDGSQCDS
ncbi:protein amnionless [Pelodytes ibericus]